MGPDLAASDFEQASRVNRPVRLLTALAVVPAMLEVGPKSPR